jgi:hypothetical protein
VFVVVALGAVAVRERTCRWNLLGRNDYERSFAMARLGMGGIVLPGGIPSNDISAAKLDGQSTILPLEGKGPVAGG